MEKAIECMAVAPRRILRLPEMKVEEGADACLTLIDTEKKWTVKGSEFASLSCNTPFEGWELTGGPVGVVNNGQLYLND